MAANIIKAGPEAYRQAAQILQSGGLVGLPTETVYGLAGDARNEKAVSDIYKVKGRPSFNPLIAHILHPSDAHTFVEVSELAEKLMKVFWPGPLTLVLPSKPSDLCTRATAGLETLAIRCPDAPWRLPLRKFGFAGPLVMPSANLSGHISPTTAEHVANDLDDKIDLIIDGGSCDRGVESTILKIEDNHAVLLRPGTISLEDLKPFIPDLHQPAENPDISAPGMLKSHYAPKAKVRLNATDKKPGEAYLAFGKTHIEWDYNLSLTGDLVEAARHLYDALRHLDKVHTIAVAPIPEHGIGLAINDRLRRAAADR